jgi:hypothetical protein
LGLSKQLDRAAPPIRNNYFHFGSASNVKEHEMDTLAQAIADSVARVVGLTVVAEAIIGRQ